MSASKLDAVYRSILLTKFFTKGWGKPENLRRLFEFRKVVSNREQCFNLVEKDYPVTITKEQQLADCKILEGYFLSPLERCLPGIVPEIAQKAHFQAILPIHWPEKGVKPMCLHLAGTGDHYFWRRRNLMVKPLLKEAGIGGIILENPFYGLRKPEDQIRSSLHNVSDIFVMGGCLILESLVLFHWCERNGLGPLGVTGLSMGGHMASLAATNWPKPLVLVPCLSWSTASAVFLQGVMSQSINWDLLEDQYMSDGVYREKLSKMVTIVDEAFLAGKKFARTYSETMENNTQPRANKENVDITYKEIQSNVIDVSRNLEPTQVTKSSYLEPFQLEKIREELKKLLVENKISQVLYDKLISDEKFVLDPEDIEDINNLSEERLKEILLKAKIANANYEQPIKVLIPPSNEVVQNKPIQVKTTEIKEEITIKQSIKEEDRNKKNITKTSAQINEDNIPIVQSAEAISTNKAIAQSIDTDPTNKSMVKSTETNKSVVKSAKDKSSWSSDWNLPFWKSSGKKIDINKIHWRDREALQFMRGVMDECTHLSNFSMPFDTSLIIAVCAKHDAYVPRDDVGTLEEIWPGAEVRYVDAGHVSAYILHQSLFRSCIKEAFERSKKKWKDGKHIA